LRHVGVARRFSVIWLTKELRPLLPGYELPFELITDAGVVTARVSSSEKNMEVGDPEAGQFIQGGLEDWYDRHRRLSAYPTTPAARKVIQAQAKCNIPR
jgi:hypothetical protein